MPVSPTLIVLAGPTAVGKTALSLQLAQAYNTGIISADSRQIYRGLNIGTAKVTREEQAMVPHHFIDMLDVGTDYSAGQFEHDALELLNQGFRQNPVWIVAGGSGLYIRALCQGMDRFPDVDPAVRKRWNDRWQKEGLEPLQKTLEQLDPKYYDQVDRQNPQRLIRALEICESTGKPYSSFRSGHSVQRPFRILKFCLDMPRDLLYDRINQRVVNMMEAGLESEARQYYGLRHHNALQTVGYQELFSHFDGLLNLSDAVALIQQNTRRFAKRQLTWFRKDPDFHWIKPDDLASITQALHV